MIHVELHRHSKWSMLDGSGDGEQWAKRAAKIGMPALALTDHGTIAGILEHINGCKEAGIMPLCGVEMYFKDNRLVQTGQRFHLTLLAMNYEGWISIQKLTSEAYATGFFQNENTISYKPHADWELLARHSKGVYCLSGCIGGMFSNLIQQGVESEVKLHVQRMRSIYGPNFSIEVQHHDFDAQRLVNLAAYRVSYETGVPLTATGDPHYPYESWGNMNDTMFMLSSKTSNLKRLAKEEKKAAKAARGEEIEKKDDVYTMKQDNPTLYLMNGAQKYDAYTKYHPQLPQNVVVDAIAHSGEIMKGFAPFMLDRDIKMPPLTRRIISKIDEWSIDYIASIENYYGDRTHDWLDEVDDQLVKDTLRRWAKEGLEKLGQTYPQDHWQQYNPQIYIDQIEREFETFEAIGIHVWRYMTMAAGEVRWAKDHGVIVGPGRGSAAGSLVAYCVGITDIDPISYGLMFERFININRKGMPDIDIDFMPGPRGRDIVKKHTGEVYGESNVIDIAAMGTYGPRKAIQDVCRVFDDEIDFVAADKVRRAIDLKPTDNMDLEECATKFPELADFKRMYPFLWDMATRIEGAPYSYSRHASGVLVKPNDQEIATSHRYNKETKGTDKVTAWSDSKEQLADYGWLKLDFLVIDGLVRQYEIIQALKQRENLHVDLRLLPVRWNPLATDPVVMQQFHRAATLGVWQMEGKGTIPVLKSIKPDNMHDLAAINALIRPGPRGAGMTEQYAKIKNGTIPLTYWHDAVEPALKNTYGLMIYQEQAMEICVQLGGFTRTEADDIRKAMGKLYRQGIEVVKKFLRDKGYEEKFVHEASKMVGEEKAIEIWDAVMAFGGYSFNASHAYAYALISYHDMYLKTLAPADFYAWLLTFTKSEQMAEKMQSAMREGSKFGIRINCPDINYSEIGFKVADKQTIFYGLESIKNIGTVAAQEIFEKRPFASYEDFEERVVKKKVNKLGKQALVSVGAFDRFGARAHMTEAEKASHEEAYMGMKLSGKTDVEKYADLIEATISTEYQFDEAQHKTFMCVGGEITNVKHTRTKSKGEPMGFISLAYGTDTYRVTMFPAVWAQFSQQMRTGKIFLFEGLKDVSEQYGNGFIATNAISIEDWAASQQARQAA